jgi:DNA replication protein DnaC
MLEAGEALAALARKARAACGLEGDALYRTFDEMEVDSHNREAILAAVEFADGIVAGTARRGLYVFGPRTGTGKTHLAEAVVNRVTAAGVFARFVRVVSMPRNDQEAIEDLAGADWPLVVLDDVGAAKATPRLVECIYSIVDGRTWAGAPLLLTSNLGPDVLAKQLGSLDAVAGERIASRIVGGCDLVPLGGPDRRRSGR